MSKCSLRLRFDRFVRGNHQHHQIDAAHPRQHITHEPLVPRHIHKPNSNLPKIQEREPQINRDSSPLFFRQPIRISSGQRLDQRRFAVIDMPRGPDNNVFQGLHGTRFALPVSQSVSSKMPRR